MSSPGTDSSHPLVPASLTAEPIRTLIGFGVTETKNPTRYFHHHNGDGVQVVETAGPNSTGYGFDVQVKGGIARRHAVFELDPLVVDGNPVRQIFVAYEEKKRIVRVEQVSLAAAAFKGIHRCLQPVAPIVCSVRVCWQHIHSRNRTDTQRLPLVMLVDEALDRMVLAIGNVGDRIEWTPYATGGFKPPWFSSLKVVIPRRSQSNGGMLEA